MNFNTYQKKAMSTCMPTCDNFAYMLTNLVGEVGEFAGKVAKAIRKDHLHIEADDLRINQSWANDFDEFQEELKKEAGDILWQLSGLCEVMGWELEEVARMNLEKLAGRQERGLIDGSGDNR